MPKGLPFVLTDYLELVDWTGRIIRQDKRGAIPADTPPILKRLQIQPEAWLELTTGFENNFCTLVGRASRAYRDVAPRAVRRSRIAQPFGVTPPGGKSGVLCAP